ncbi:MULTISPECIES: aminodeoxychorismate synthase component I [unclassified Pseudoalteromonas]|uniref:aminodeoxychorismate synthase component I n=1 Tax=unclassified Pseudoalteromonas TaxID=194690 RepID=UPI0025B5D4F9|nr:MULTISPECIES: aminodeoxychorismate synthase component I [unclassified Pseudoalteromonas]MDN3380012.1 aminodeoxychorismate synthase component I [Pseudoalteromonas sp. APC 3893]MDN3388351.1 aminodeoxychorismate synthase component I [Pseudoalteromonas sp. APC 4017]
MIKQHKTCIQLDISLNCAEVFSYFCDLPYAVLLDSANSEHENSRFDIIAIAPLMRLEVKNNQVFVDDQLTEQSCFTVLQTQLNKLNDTKAHPELPFNGGWLGYFGYDFGRVIEKLPENAINDIDMPQLAVGLYPDALIYDKQQSTWFYIAQPNTDRLALYLSALDDTAKQRPPFEITQRWSSNMSKAQYTDKFAQIQAYLKSGDCYQINLAQRFSAQYKGSAWQAYCTLREANKAPFSSFINHPDGAILSISPERFIAINDGQIQTKPIKGTLPRCADESADQQQAIRLQRSNKDRAENVMIVDLLRNDLGKVAKPGTVSVPSLFAIESFPAVHHLVSTVTAQLAEGKTAVDQLHAAFPGGSITGAPKIRAMEIIEELEPHRRSIYCGSIGYLSACGNMDTSITIRTLVCHKQHIYCWAGGGIVADSQADLEYQETYDKVNKILPLLK